MHDLWHCTQFYQEPALYLWWYEEGESTRTRGRVNKDKRKSQQGTNETRGIITKYNNKYTRIRVHACLRWYMDEGRDKQWYIV